MDKAAWTQLYLKIAIYKKKYCSKYYNKVLPFDTRPVVLF